MRRDLSDSTTLGARKDCSQEARATAEADSVREFSSEDEIHTEAKYLNKRAVVVGGGLAGALAAAYLSKHGFDVQVYERRDDPSKKTYSAARANVIRLFPETAKVMRDGGIELPASGYRNGVHKLLGLGFMAHTKILPDVRGGDADNACYIGERNQIGDIITKDVQRKNPTRIHFHYNNTCKSADFSKRQLVFENGQREEVIVDCDLLIAADGANSFIRKKLLEYDPRIRITSFPNRGAYKSIRDLTLPHSDEEVMKGLSEGWVAYVSVRRTLSFDQRSYQALNLFYRSPDGVVHGTIYAMPETFERVKGREAQWLREMSPPYFPEVWVKEMAERLQTAPLCDIPTTHKLSRLCGPRTILLGDAGHSVTATIGLGANCAIQDTRALDAALSEADGDLDSVGEIFNRSRIRDVHDLQDLQIAMDYKEIFFPWSESWRAFVGWVHADLVAMLRRLLPNLVTPNVAVQVERPHMTPGEALKLLNRDALIVSVLLVAVVSTVVRCLLIPAVNYVITRTGG